MTKIVPDAPDSAAPYTPSGGRGSIQPQVVLSRK